MNDTMQLNQQKNKFLKLPKKMEYFKALGKDLDVGSQLNGDILKLQKMHSESCLNLKRMLSIFHSYCVNAMKQLFTLLQSSHDLSSISGKDHFENNGPFIIRMSICFTILCTAIGVYNSKSSPSKAGNRFNMRTIKHTKK